LVNKLEKKEITVVKQNLNHINKLFPVILVILIGFSKTLPETKPDISLIHLFSRKVSNKGARRHHTFQKAPCSLQEGFTPSRKFRAVCKKVSHLSESSVQYARRFHTFQKASCRGGGKFQECHATIKKENIRR
jgi:hypothetical protein